MSKKILFVYYQNIKPNGVSKVLSSLTWELAEQGFDIEILFLMAPHDDFYPIHPKIKKHYINSFGNQYARLGSTIAKKYKKIPKSHNVYSYLYDLASYQVLNEWITENHHHYKTIVACWYKLATMLSLKDEINKKTIAWEHISYKTGGLLWYKTLRKYYRNLKGIVCINEGGLQHYKNLNPNTHLIFNPIDDALERKKLIKASEKENLISMICRLDPEKNVMEFLQIFKASKIPENWKVEIMGQGREKEKLQKFIDENHLSERVRLMGIGSSDDVYRMMARSKISCLTSTVEAFGMVLLEAMFSSNAIIAYDCNYGPSDIVNEKNGFLIPLHDKRMFQEKLELVTQNPEVLENLMKSSFEDAQNWRKEFTQKEWKKLL